VVVILRRTDFSVSGVPSFASQAGQHKKGDRSCQSSGQGWWAGDTLPTPQGLGWPHLWARLQASLDPATILIV